MNISSFYITKKNKLYENILLLFILSILTYFLVFSNINFKIVSDVVNVFLKILVPSLFPFILFSNILSLSGCFNLIANSKICKLIKLFFRISTYSASAVIFGFLFGYPNGARYINELYEKNRISYKEAEYLLLFINNASPTFILSSVGIGMLKNIRIGSLLLISHIISSILVGIIYRFKYNLCKEIKKTTDNNYYIDSSYNQTNFNFSFNILYTSISKSLLTLGFIFGFMTVFTLLYNYVITILEYILPVNNNIKYSFLSIMEISSGLKNFTSLNISLKAILPFISFFLGFSSLSIIFQIFSCVYLNKFKLQKILKGKFIHGILSAIVTYALVNIPYVYEYINSGKEVNLNIDKKIITNNIFNNHIIISLIIFILHLLLFAIYILYKKKRLAKNLIVSKGG